MLRPFVEGEILVWDDNSAGAMWDLCIARNGEHLGAVEVTTSTDPDLRRFQAQLDALGGTKQDAPENLAYSWVVDLETHAKPQKLDFESLHHLLEAAETAGVEHIETLNEGPFFAEANALDVSFAYPIIGGEPGYLYLGFGSTWWMGDDNVSRHVDAEAMENEKLASAPPSRHLFVWIDWADFPGAFEMREEPPPDPPGLPEFVDVAWAACAVWSHEPILWRSRRGEAWEVLTPHRPPTSKP